MSETVEKDPASSNQATPIAAPRGVTAFFALAAFVGAALLFTVQPLIARLLLPSYGGSPSVWSTSSLFFQVLLLLGYLYTHWSTTRLGRSWQPRAHILVLLAPIVVLPIALPAVVEPGEHSPVLWLLRTLTLMIGLPFLVVATTGPLLQKWYSWTNARRSEDPYFLFAASNLGSFGGLLAYPFLIEPTMTLDQQRLAWSVGFGTFVVLTASCGLIAARAKGGAREEVATETLGLRALGARESAVWLALAFLPSALMLAVTAHVTTDVAAIPLLWVVPLAIYLATFVVAFARESRVVPTVLTRIAVGLGFAAALVGIMPNSPIPQQVALLMVMLALVGYAAHARLAATRPDPSLLTGFYLVVAFGGALGGALVGLIAPTVFDRVLEYPLVMIAIPFLMWGVAAQTDEREPSRWQSAGLLLFAAVTVLSVAGTVTGTPQLWLVAWPCLTILAVMLGFRLSVQPVILVTALVVVFGGILVVDDLRSIDQRRTFFGSHQVRESDEMHTLVHGTTVHGTQFRDERSTIPTTYYAPSGPLGAVFRQGKFSDVGAIGLGAGTVAAYGEPGMSFTFFEIDAEVAEIAMTPRFFTYISDSEADVDIVIGDGRLKMADEPEASFDLIILDAFSSDSVPVHLLTVEAMRTYGERLRSGGAIAVNVSNRVFDLGDVIAGSARELGWIGAEAQGGKGDGASVSQWVVVSPSTTLIDALKGQEDWDELDSDRVLWTDDNASILSALP